MSDEILMRPEVGETFTREVSGHLQTFTIVAYTPAAPVVGSVPKFLWNLPVYVLHFHTTDEGPTIDNDRLLVWPASETEDTWREARGWRTS